MLPAWRVLGGLLLVLSAVVGPAAGSAATPASPAPVAAASTAGTSTDAAGPGADGARIVAVVPNPTAPDDAGEHLVVDFPAHTELETLTIRDGEGVARPAENRTVAGEVVLTTDPGRLRNRTDRTVVGLEGSLALANGGERVRLCAGNTTLDAVTYRDAPEGEQYVPGEGWQPPGRTEFGSLVARNVPVAAFVLPDGAGAPTDALAAADRRLYLAGYSFTSRRATRELLAAERRGVDVRVLLDDAPVGGVSERQVGLLDRLAAAGVSVRVLTDPGTRYRFHHAKYAVVDGRALVTSENWKPSGTGGHGSRGWGVVVDDPALAANLSAVFEADRGWRAATAWENATVNASTTTRPANDTYPAAFPPTEFTAERARLVVGPDAAERELTALLRAADHSLRVQQVGIENGSPVLRETLAAARRGVHVQVLLSNAWYAREDNERLARYLRRVAREEGLALEARLAEPRSRYGYVHVKGVLADGERALVGSVNWNNNSIRQNREVAVVLAGERVASYYGRVFRSDWRGGRWRLTVGLLAVGALAVLALAAVPLRVRFRRCS